MLASELAPKEMRKEVRRLIRNLSRRITNIEGLGTSAPQYAVNKYRNLEKDLPRDLRKLSPSKLTTLYRDLTYIGNLKTSTVKGALKVSKTFEPIRQQLDVLSPDLRNKFWEIYGKLYGETGGQIENFKYEIFNTNIDYIYSGEEADKAVLDIMQEYDKTLRELGSRATDEEIKILFTSKLDTLRK